MSVNQYKSSVFHYIQDKARIIDNISQSTGIAPEMIMAGPAEELDTIKSKTWVGAGMDDALNLFTVDYIANQYEYAIDVFGFTDEQAKQFVHGMIEREFAITASIPEVTRNDGLVALIAHKLAHPLVRDLGPGNINAATAIELIKFYEAEFQSDEFGLAKYVNNYGQLLLDLSLGGTSADILTFQLSALHAYKAQQFYQTYAPNTWNNPSSDPLFTSLLAQYPDMTEDDYRAALVSLYYNRGGERMLQEALDAQANGIAYVPITSSTAPSLLETFEKHIANADNIDFYYSLGLVDHSEYLLHGINLYFGNSQNLDSVTGVDAEITFRDQSAISLAEIFASFEQAFDSAGNLLDLVGETLNDFIPLILERINGGGTLRLAVNGEYTIQQGDTLSELAIQFNTTVEQLLNANPSILDEDLIYEGQILKVPGATKDFDLNDLNIDPAPDTGEAKITRDDWLSDKFESEIAALQIGDPFIFGHDIESLDAGIDPFTDNFIVYSYDADGDIVATILDENGDPLVRVTREEGGFRRERLDQGSTKFVEFLSNAGEKSIFISIDGVEINFTDTLVNSAVKNGINNLLETDSFIKSLSASLAGMDTQGRTMIDVDFLDSSTGESKRQNRLYIENGEVVQIDKPAGNFVISERVGDGETELLFHMERTVLDEDGKPKLGPDGKPITHIVPISVSEISFMIGSTVGNHLAGDNIFAQIGFSSVLGVVGENLAETIGEMFIGVNEDNSLVGALGDAWDDAGVEFGKAFKGAIIGQITSFLVSELADALGLEGVGLELFDVASSEVVSTVLTNLAEMAGGAENVGAFDGLSLEGAFGGYLGSKLGDLVTGDLYSSTEALAGSLGSAIGGYIGSTIAQAFFIPAPIGKFIGSFIGKTIGVGTARAFEWNPAIASVALIFGGFIGVAIVGYIFGEPPTAHANVTFNPETGEFGIASSGANYNGDEELILELTQDAVDYINAFVGGIGGVVINGTELGSKFSYELHDFFFDGPGPNVETQDPGEMIQSGVLQTVRATKIAGGEFVLKRALGRSDATSLSGLFGDMEFAADYARYLQNSAAINLVMEASPDSAFTAGWIITLQRAYELGLHLRYDADWYGGFNFFHDELNAVAGLTELSLADGEREMRLMTADGEVTVIGDVIELGAKTNIAMEAPPAGEASVLDLRFEDGGYEIDVAASVQGTDGNDLIFSGNRGNDIFGGLGDDTVYGGGNADWIFGGGGADYLFAGDVDGNALFGEAGDDTLYGGTGSDWIEGGDGADTVFANGSGDMITGGLGDDTMEGGTGDDSYIVRKGDGVDTVREGTNYAVIVPASTFDPAQASNITTEQSPLLSFGEFFADPAQVSQGFGNWGGGVSSSIGEEVLQEAATLTGLQSAPASINDVTTDYARNLALVLDPYREDLAQQINDAVDTAEANNDDSYKDALLNMGVFDTADGEWTKDDSSGTTVYELPQAPLHEIAAGVSDLLTYDQVAGGKDAVVFGEGISLENLRLERVVNLGDTQFENDLRIRIFENDAEGNLVDTGQAILLEDWFDPFRKVEFLRFADGQEVRIAHMSSFIFGTNGNDTLIGTAGADFIHGAGGDDWIEALLGSDIAIGGTGDDIVGGQEGNDVVVGADGADILTGGDGHDIITGDAGTDDIYAGGGDDTISGGRGDDVVIGGAGDDVFRYGRGDGRDTLYDGLSNEWETVWVDGVWQETANYKYEQDGNRVIRTDKNTSQQTVLLEDRNILFGRFEFAAGTRTLEWHPADGSGDAVNAGSDTLEFDIGIDIQDIHIAQDGNDILLGLAGPDASVPDVAALDDVIRLKDAVLTGPAIEQFAFFNSGIWDVSTTTGWLGGTAGDDLITATEAENWITGGDGDDTITGNTGSDLLNGNRGNDILSGGAGDDTLFGGAGHDELDGGAGADVLVGGTGFDIASYESAQKGVFVDLGRSSEPIRGLKAEFYKEVTQETQWVMMEGILQPIIVTVVTQLDSVDDAQNLINTTAPIAQHVATNFDYGTGGSETIETFVENDMDTLTGDISTSFDDVAVRYTGYIELTAGTHYFNVASDDGFRLSIGGQVFSEFTGNRSYATTIASGDFEAGIYEFELIYYDAGSAEQLNVRTGPNLFSTEVLTSDDLFHLPREVLPEGTTQTDAAGRTYYAQLDWDAIDDKFIGIEGLKGSAFGDTLIGDFRSNELTGGQGHDRLEGGGGHDIYMFESGHGDDVISDTGGFDAIRFGSGISLGMLTIAWNGDDLTISSSPTDQITVSDAATTQTVEGLFFENGESASLSSIITDGLGTADNDLVLGTRGAASTLTGGDGADALVGYDGTDNLSGGLGDDLLIGGSGGDVLDGGDGVDTVSYTASNAAVTIDLGAATASGGSATGDTLTGIENLLGSAYADTLIGDTVDNVFEGGAGDDTLTGADGNDTLIGGAGADTQYGNSGDDILDGGAGDDWADGGSGNDILSGGEGNDILWGNLGHDEISGGSGNDTLDGADGNDVLIGGAGNDLLRGKSGNDVLAGGAGDDTLRGGTGSDSYIVGTQSGNDTIITGGDADRLFFELAEDRQQGNLAYRNIWFARSGDNLVLTVIGEGSSVTVENWYTSDSNKLAHIDTRLSTLSRQNVQTLVAEMAATGLAVAPSSLDELTAEQRAIVESAQDAAWLPGGTEGDGKALMTGTQSADVLTVDSLLIEAESYTGSAPGAGAAVNSTWAVDTTLPGYSGEALIATGEGVNTGDTTEGPRLDYRVTFDTPGTYYVSVRMHGASGSDDSIHVGLNGTPVTYGEFGLGGAHSGWEWLDTAASQRVQIDVTQAGTHTLNLWMREDGVRIDQIYLSTDSNEVPPARGDRPAAKARFVMPASQDMLIETEDYTTSTPGTGSAANTAWVSDTSMPGYSEEALIAQTTPSGPDVNTGDSTHGARLDYEINFDTPGTYYVHARVLGESGTDDSIHVGLDGTPLTYGSDGLTAVGATDWEWRNLAAGQAVQFEITEAGIHRLNLWMREDGTRIDQLFLTTDPAAIPPGVGTMNATRPQFFLPDAGPGQTLRGLDGDDSLTGGAQADVLEGGAGTDTLTGGGGDDTLIGGDGLADIAVYSGTSTDYTIEANGFGSGFTVTDNNTADGDEGTDNLSEVEYVRFSDGDVLVADLPPTSFQSTMLVTEVAENSGGIDIATFSATDPNGDTVIYEIADDPSGAFVINGNTLRLELPLDYEQTGSPHRVLVQARGGLEATDPIAVDLSVTNVNEPLDFTADTFNFSVHEDQSPLATLGAPQLDDEDGDAVFSITSGNLNNAFSIDAQTGELFRNEGALDYWNDVDRYTLTIEATDGVNTDQATALVDVIARDGGRVGTMGNDALITGRIGNDRLFGDAGDDTLQGGEGDDLLVGGLGNDTLRASDGDILWGDGTGWRLFNGNGYAKTLNPISNFATDEITIQFTLKDLDQSHDNNTLLTYASFDNMNEIELKEPDDIYFRFNNTTNQWVDSNLAQNGDPLARYTLTWTKSTNTLQFYKNGNLKRSYSNITSADLDNGGYLAFGSEQSSAGSFSGGNSRIYADISNLRIWNKALSQTELANIEGRTWMQSGDPFFENLVLDYTFNPADVANLVDYSLNNNPGLVVGSSGMRSGADTFDYDPGNGQVTIADFAVDTVRGELANDKLDLRGYTSATDLASVLSLATQVGSDTVIDFGNGDVLTLNNVTKTDLTDADFQYYVPNTSPVALNDNAYGTSVFGSIDVLSNDYDPDGDMIFMDALLGYSGMGTASLLGDSIFFSVTGGNGSSVTATYRIRDEHGATDTATATYTYNDSGGGGGQLPPLVFDLDGDGLELTGPLDYPVTLDITPEGVDFHLDWISPDDGLLALDRNGNGTIELISEISFIGDLEGARTDLEGLVAFDTNDDGVLDASDARFADFRIWQDMDSDGESDAGELRTLSDAGITSISLTPGPVSTDLSGSPTKSQIVGETVFTRDDGTTGLVGDVMLHAELVDPPAVEGLPLGLVGLWVPDSGEGNQVPDLAGEANATLRNGLAASDAGTRFDGADDYLEIPFDEALKLDQGTVVLRFTTEEVSGPMTLLAQDTTGGQGLIIRVTGDGAVEVSEPGRNQGKVLRTAAGVIQAGQEHTLAVGFGEDGVQLYLDGAAVAADFHAHSLIGAFSQLIIGAANKGGNGEPAEFFKGSIGSIALYERRLADAEIAAMGAVRLGSRGDETIEGAAGDDTLIGRGGNDILIGGEGVDIYSWKPGDGDDIILNTDSLGGDDHILFGGGLTAADLRFDRSGDDMRISILNHGETVTIRDWYADNRAKLGIDVNGEYFSASDVDRLEGTGALPPADSNSDNPNGEGPPANGGHLGDWREELIERIAGVLAAKGERHVHNAIDRLETLIETAASEKANRGYLSFAHQLLTELSEHAGLEEEGDDSPPDSEPPLSWREFVKGTDALDAFKAWLSSRRAQTANKNAEGPNIVPGFGQGFPAELAVGDRAEHPWLQTSVAQKLSQRFGEWNGDVQGQWDSGPSADDGVTQEVEGHASGDVLAADEKATVAGWFDTRFGGEPWQEPKPRDAETQDEVLLNPVDAAVFNPSGVQDAGEPDIDGMGGPFLFGGFPHSLAEYWSQDQSREGALQAADAAPASQDDVLRLIQGMAHFDRPEGFEQRLRRLHDVVEPRYTLAVDAL